jgi:hypothetical protein
MWQIEADVAACDVTSKNDVSKMMLSYPLRRTKSENEIAERDQIQKHEIEQFFF